MSRQRFAGIPVVPAVDEYAKAHREMQEMLTSRKRNWNGLDFDDRTAPEVTWQATDSHVQALLARKGDPRIVLHELGFEPRDEDAALVRWRQERERAKELMEMRVKLGLPVDDDLRRQAEEPDNGPAVAQLVDAMRQRSKRTWARVRSGQT